jgi:phosphinothricin acetyltransferase
MIRLASSEDAAAIAVIYAPYVTDTFISFEEEPPDAAEMAARLRGVHPFHAWLVSDDAGCVEGYASASPHRTRAAYRWSVDVSVYVAENSHRKGVGRALYGRLLALLRAQGFKSAFAGIALPNGASVALHESMGFAPIGLYRDVGYKLGAWRDVGWWQLILNPGDAAPTALLPFEAVADSVLANWTR